VTDPDAVGAELPLLVTRRSLRRAQASVARARRTSPRGVALVVAAAFTAGAVATAAAALLAPRLLGGDDGIKTSLAEPTASSSTGGSASSSVSGSASATGTAGVVGPPLGAVTGSAASATTGKGGAAGTGGTGGVARTVVTSPALTWKPPRLASPQTVVVRADSRSLKLDPAKDYRVVLPRTQVDLGGGLSITGGHNVVIMGGVVWISDRITDRAARRGLYFKGQTGTLHVEGVRLSGFLADGINFDEREGAVVQLQNIVIDHVYGGKDANHADLIQTWAGPSVLRIDGLRGTTDYQGFFLLPNQHWPEGPVPQEVTLRRTHVTMMPKAGYALWLPDGSTSWLDPRGMKVTLPSDESPDRLSWPNNAVGVGVVGDNGVVDLPAGAPGGGYTSPGYQ
jgi:hypothetical protein